MVVYPDDPAIRYTEYAHAIVTHAGAVFDRPGVPNGNGIASPGTRINFRTDATRVSVMVNYTFACQALGCGHFSAERDGRLTVHGDRRLAERFARMFPVPDGQPPE